MWGALSAGPAGRRPTSIPRQRRRRCVPDFAATRRTRRRPARARPLIRMGPRRVVGCDELGAKMRGSRLGAGPRLLRASRRSADSRKTARTRRTRRPDAAACASMGWRRRVPRRVVGSGAGSVAASTARAGSCRRAAANSANRTEEGDRDAALTGYEPPDARVTKSAPKQSSEQTRSPPHRRA